MRKYIIKLIILVLLLACMLLPVINAANFACADADEYYIICKPTGEVNVRRSPKLKSPIVACVFFGQKVITDGKEKNGFVHVIGLSAETDCGWIYKGLLVKDQPIVSEGYAQVFKSENVACRKYASTDSKILKRLDEGTNVKVYAISEEWCVTEYGYIMTEFLTLNAPVRGRTP